MVGIEVVQVFRAIVGRDVQDVRLERLFSEDKAHRMAGNVGGAPSCTTFRVVRQ